MDWTDERNRNKSINNRKANDPDSNVSTDRKLEQFSYKRVACTEAVQVAYDHNMIIFNNSVEQHDHFIFHKKLCDL